MKILAAALSSLILGLGFLISCEGEEPRVSAYDSPAEGWQVHVAEPEAGEDEPATVLLTRRAEVGPEASRPRLVIGCEDAETKVYVEWGTALGAGTTPVVTHIDDEPEQTHRWTISDDGEAVGLWHDEVSVPFLRALSGRDHLTASVHPEGQPPLLAAFALSGLDTLLVRVRRECSW